MKKTDAVFCFAPGARVYVRNWSGEQSVVVTALALHRGWPHYFVVDSNGDEWQIAQIELSSKPIPAEVQAFYAQTALTLNNTEAS